MRTTVWASRNISELFKYSGKGFCSTIRCFTFLNISIRARIFCLDLISGFLYKLIFDIRFKARFMLILLDSIHLVSRILIVHYFLLQASFSQSDKICKFSRRSACRSVSSAKRLLFIILPPFFIPRWLLAAYLKISSFLENAVERRSRPQHIPESELFSVD